MTQPKRTPLYELHQQLGAKMVPFAGYTMPVQYPAGVIAEHQHCRTKAGLFDVSHMGQLRVRGPSWEAVATAFETLVPQDVLGLQNGRQRYGFFTNNDGKLESDFMFARVRDELLIVVNAASRAGDMERLRTLEGLSVDMLDDRALLALQGPAAGAVMEQHDASTRSARFMDVVPVRIAGTEGWASRSGYTGEDGFEISVPADRAEAVARALLVDPVVAPIGLGARDSLRLEAGLCLYGSDIYDSTTVKESGLLWAVQKVRRPGGAREGGYPGADVALADPARLRVGLKPEGRALMRAGVQLFATEDAENAIGGVTSGGFGPSVGGPIAMGYVAIDHTETGTRLWGEVRGKRLPVDICALPFVPANFKR